MNEFISMAEAMAEIDRLKGCLSDDVDDVLMRAALREAGVDNWTGYEHAQERYEEMVGELEASDE